MIQLKFRADLEPLSLLAMQTPLRAVTISEAQEAHATLLQSDAVVRTPLVRLNWAPPWANASDLPEIWLKLECLQPTIGSFKVRGAGNAISNARPAELARGVVTASAGNMGQGVAANARLLGVPCTVVVPDGAPATKVAAIRRLGARVIAVPFDEWWQIIQTGECRQAEGHFVHPVLDHVEVRERSVDHKRLLHRVDCKDDCIGRGGLGLGSATCLVDVASWIHED